MINMYGTYKIKIEGTRPLLMHNPASMLEPTDSGKKRAGVYDADEDAERALYKSPDGKVAIPARIIKACLREASKDFKVPGKGKKTFKDFVKAGLSIRPDYIEVSGDWATDVQLVIIGRSRIPRARPRFDRWSLVFECQILDPIIQEGNLRDFCESGGQYKGICDFRPEYGLFEVKSFERVDIQN